MRLGQFRDEDVAFVRRLDEERFLVGLGRRVRKALGERRVARVGQRGVSGHGLSV